MDEVQRLRGRFVLSLFEDGRVYSLPWMWFRQTGFMFRIAFKNDVVIKVPTEHGLEHFGKTFSLDYTAPDFPRPVEEMEHSANIEQLRVRFPGLGQLGLSQNAIHFLLVHKLQYDRLGNSIPGRIPDTRFCACWIKPAFSCPSLRPAIVQERVSGETLWKQYFATESRRAVEQLRKQIRQDMQEFLHDSVRSHIDFNIKNFIVTTHGDTPRIVYVDSKPTPMTSKRRNDHNLQGILKEFAVRPQAS